ncbi:hypothetical protein L1887_25156 [Cichorium endivia]|nr:hypothetical protein L1887_25156 [Cichorium endivia]
MKIDSQQEIKQTVGGHYLNTLYLTASFTISSTNLNMAWNKPPTPPPPSLPATATAPSATYPDSLYSSPPLIELETKLEIFFYNSYSDAQDHYDLMKLKCHHHRNLSSQTNLSSHTSIEIIEKDENVYTEDCEKKQVCGPETLIEKEEHEQEEGEEDRREAATIVAVAVGVRRGNTNSLVDVIFFLIPPPPAINLFRRAVSV